MGIIKRKRASAPIYVSPNQLTLEGFQTPFKQHLSKDDRWVVLAHLIPWDEVCAIYLKHVGGKQYEPTGNKATCCDRLIDYKTPEQS